MVSGGDDADVRMALAGLTDPAEALLFDDLQEFGLDRQVHVADLVEEQRALVGHLEQAGLARHRARERALLMTEQFRVHEFA